MEGQGKAVKRGSGRSGRGSEEAVEGQGWGSEKAVEGQRKCGGRLGKGSEKAVEGQGKAVKRRWKVREGQ